MNSLRPPTRHLIVNADDFGLSPGVNQGIIETFERGIVTSGSLMVRQPAAAAAAAYARRNPNVSIGLHLDLGEWFYQNGDWAPLYTVVPITDATAVAAEVWSQLAEFERLVGRPPTHIDSHQHVHRQEPVRALVAGLASRLGVPLRQQTPGLVYCGDFYGQTGEGESLPGALCLDNLGTILASLPEGITELGCHPGYDDGLATSYRAERALEVQTLCAPELPRILALLGLELCSFSNFPHRAAPVALA